MKLLVLMVSVLVGVVSGQANRCFPDERLERQNRTFLVKVERFGLDLFKQIVTETEENVFMSPYSIWSALSLAYYGAAGDTKRQMEDAMYFTSKNGVYSGWNALRLLLLRNNPGVRLRTANRAYFSDQIALDRCLSNTLFDLRLVDFTNNVRAKEAINQEVNITTEGRIPDLIQFLPPTTRMALVNAVFFKGDWRSKFDENATIKLEFLVSPSQSSGVVDMMMQKSTFRIGFSEVLDATLLELPYKDATLSMFLLLPTSFSTDTTINNLTPETLVDAYRNANVTDNVLVGLPRFKITTRLEDQLKQVLKSFGIVNLFEAGLSDLTDFSPSGGLSVDQAIHQATIEVTEEGTTAAAATALINTRLGIAREQTFICNRPFVLLITDKNAGVTLFAGRILNSTDLESIPV